MLLLKERPDEPLATQQEVKIIIISKRSQRVQIISSHYPSRVKNVEGSKLVGGIRKFRHKSLIFKMK